MQPWMTMPGSSEGGSARLNRARGRGGARETPPQEPLSTCRASLLPGCALGRSYLLMAMSCWSTCSLP